MKGKLVRLIENNCMANSKYMNYELVVEDLMKIINFFIVCDEKLRLLDANNIKSIMKDNVSVFNFEEIVKKHIFCVDNEDIDYIFNNNTPYKEALDIVYEELAEIIYEEIKRN
jgi:hypothetical protein